MRRIKQAILLGVCALILVALVCIYGKLEINEYLGCQVVSESQFQEIIADRQPVDDNVLGELQMNGIKAPYDARKEVWYIPQSTETKKYTGKLSFSNMDVRLVLKDTGWETEKENVIGGNEPVEFLAFNSKYYVLGTLVFSGLPILALETDAVTEEYVCGNIRVFDPETEVKPYYSSTEMRMGYRIRGNFSRNYDKKGYRLLLMDEKGGETSASLVGMREDGDWILNALYTDPNRIREKICTELWNETSDTPGTRMEYVELFINDSYEGIYGLFEPIDYKQLNLDRNNDYLYKIRNWGVPTDADIEAAQNQETCLSIEVKNGDRPITKKLWEPFGEYANGMFFSDRDELVATMEHEKFYESIIETALFIEMICGVDNQYKNQYISAVRAKDGYIFKKIPWDFDMSWGVIFSQTDPLWREYSIENAKREVQDENFERVLETGLYQEAITEKWNLLRESVYSEGNIIAKMEKYNELLKASGAYQRENERWPDSQVSDDISCIKEFATERLSVLDQRYGFR